MTLAPSLDSALASTGVDRISATDHSTLHRPTGTAVSADTRARAPRHARAPQARPAHGPARRVGRQRGGEIYIRDQPLHTGTNVQLLSSQKSCRHLW